MRAKRKAVRGDFKAEIIRLHGNVCCNCGSDKDIEWHHIVPIEIGGNDVPSNIVPLCYDCHKAVTHNQLLIATAGRKHDKGGRKRAIPENYKEILDDYFTCKIGKAEAAKRLGWENRSNFADSDWYREYKQECGIKRFRNNIDLVFAQSKKASVHVFVKSTAEKVFLDGRPVGYVEYENGTVDYFAWNYAQNIGELRCSHRNGKIILKSRSLHEPITADQD